MFKVVPEDVTGDLGAAVRLDYDMVEVGARSYVWDHAQGRVVERGAAQGLLGSQVRRQ